MSVSNKPWSAWFNRRNRLRTLGLVSLILVNLVAAVGVIYSSFRARQLFNENQQQYREAVVLEEQWGRLLLEQSTWAAPQRIERQAREQLQMIVPQPSAMVVVVE